MKKFTLLLIIALCFALSCKKEDAQPSNNTTTTQTNTPDDTTNNNGDSNTNDNSVIDEPTDVPVAELNQFIIGTKVKTVSLPYKPFWYFSEEEATLSVSLQLDNISGESLNLRIPLEDIPNQTVSIPISSQFPPKKGEASVQIYGQPDVYNTAPNNVNLVIKPLGNNKMNISFTNLQMNGLFSDTVKTSLNVDIKRLGGRFQLTNQGGTFYTSSLSNSSDISDYHVDDQRGSDQNSQQSALLIYLPKIISNGTYTISPNTSILNLGTRESFLSLILPGTVGTSLRSRSGHVNVEIIGDIIKVTFNDVIMEDNDEIEQDRISGTFYLKRG